MTEIARKSVLIVLAANNFNETEYSIISSGLTRQGFTVYTAADAEGLCRGENGLVVKGDISFFNMRAANFAGIVVIGGKGIKKYWENLRIHSLVKDFAKEKKAIGAISQAVVCLSSTGILAGKDAVCLDEDRIDLEKDGAIFRDSDVVVSRNIVTARRALAAPLVVSNFVEILKKL